MVPSRYELSDEQWKQIEGFFPPYTTGRPSKRSNREMFNAMLWIARSGAPWRDLPERYGFWKTAYARFCKWRTLYDSTTYERQRTMVCRLVSLQRTSRSRMLFQ